MKFYWFPRTTRARIFNFVAGRRSGAIARRAPRIRRRTGIRNVVKNSSANRWPRGGALLSCSGISKEQIKPNRTRPTSMKHSCFRKGNDPRCIYTIEARFSPHRTAILHPYGNGDCDASVFRFSVAGPKRIAIRRNKYQIFRSRVRDQFVQDSPSLTFLFAHV